MSQLLEEDKVKFRFINYWIDGSFRRGEIFMLNLFNIGGDINPYDFTFGITILNFYFGIEKKD